jgi:7-cyano-7-deazaguanine synthase
VKTVLIYSGGMDSTVLLYHLLQQRDEVRALSVDYGQRHKRELNAALAICQDLGVECEIADLSAVTKLLSGSSLTSPEIPVPEGHYTAESMKLTVVPNRNMIMLSLAIGWAISTKGDRVAYAAHAGDHVIYPDCRPEFVDSMNAAARLADWQPVELSAPFLEMTKVEIAKLGAELQVPFELTWSCYQGGAVQCGRCATCCERQEAMYLARVPDRTVYLDAEYWKTVCEIQDIPKTV